MEEKVFVIQQKLSFLTEELLEHSTNVARLSFLLGKEIGLPEEKLFALYMGGLVHDVGKAFMPKYILRKDGRLNNREKKFLEFHPAMSFFWVTRELGNLSNGFFQIVAECCLYHHERLNGCGYPISLKGREIPLHARIVAVADVFSALTENRPYRSAVGPEEALEIMKKEAEEGFLDSEMIEILEYFGGERIAKKIGMSQE